MNETAKQGGYVFISHSHQDIEKVRIIRNAMEQEGYEPLCFYLKCLSDEDEIEGLIKREIDAREWFVYIDSPNARASAWVGKERAYINSLGNKRVVNIDLEKETSMTDVAGKLSRGLRVSLAYGDTERESAEALRMALVEKDLQVLDAEGPVADGCVTVSANGEIISFAAKDLEPSNIGNAVAYIEASISDNLNRLFQGARSHQEVASIRAGAEYSEEAVRLAEEADERLEEERRIKEDILAAVENGTMKMTDELKKKLDELY